MSLFRIFTAFFSRNSRVDQQIKIIPAAPTPPPLTCFWTLSDEAKSVVMENTRRGGFINGWLGFFVSRKVIMEV